MEDPDEIEQETLLVVDFVDSSDGLLEKLKEKPMKFSNLESADPVIQIGDVVFKSNYNRAVGTYMVFEQTKTRHEENIDTSESLTCLPKEYIGKTSKILEARRALVKPQEEINTNGQSH